MKKLELNQMEIVYGSNEGWLTGFTCAFSIVAGGAAIYGSGGLAAAVACNFAAAACGGLIGNGSNTGYYE